MTIFLSYWQPVNSIFLFTLSWGSSPGTVELDVKLFINSSGTPSRGALGALLHGALDYSIAIHLAYSPRINMWFWNSQEHHVKCSGLYWIISRTNWEHLIWYWFVCLSIAHWVPHKSSNELSRGWEKVSFGFEQPRTHLEGQVSFECLPFHWFQFFSLIWGEKRNITRNIYQEDWLNLCYNFFGWWYIVLLMNSLQAFGQNIRYLRLILSSRKIENLKIYK